LVKIIDREEAGCSWVQVFYCQACGAYSRFEEDRTKTKIWWPHTSEPEYKCTYCGTALERQPKIVDEILDPDIPDYCPRCQGTNVWTTSMGGWCWNRSYCEDCKASWFIRKDKTRKEISYRRV
jgi:hypothetical protein